ncbi:hypothetical protein NDU88_004437 [Pleurodeles waltl]|uniref:Uncharacterized protein n=1 Tax=Pleurodeles waltl TaxID=8319 RepID=A0AAV7WUM5_PLEWA|nr:hypothetical protein NDU88_004437 [Pleurodeles waltl]
MGALRSLRIRLSLLEKEIVTLEWEHQNSADTSLLGLIKVKIEEFQETAQAEFQHLGKYVLARSYGEGECPCATFATLLRPQREIDVIPELQDEQGQTLYDPEQVADRLRDHYADLYTSKFMHDDSLTADYLEHIAMPWLTNTYRKHLMAPLQPAEIHKALKYMQSGKAPGPDSLRVAFYKAYKDLLIQHLVTLLEEMADTCIMPDSMCEAIIITLLKPGKSPTQCASYFTIEFRNEALCQSFSQ